jgi:hypothetical protein
VTERWKLVLDESAFRFFVSRPAAERTALLRALEKLLEAPRSDSDYQTRDSTGRELQVRASKPFLITYWHDEFAKELRIVDLERVQF